MKHADTVPQNRRRNSDGQHRVFATTDRDSSFKPSGTVDNQLFHFLFSWRAFTGSGTSIYGYGKSKKFASLYVSIA